MPQPTFATSGVDLIGTFIDNNRLHLLSVLGVGAYGVVYLAQDMAQPQPVYLAVKVLLRTGLDARQRHFQQREIALHQFASRHPSVVTLHKVLEEGDYIFVIMDFLDGGDLFGMITEKQRYLGRDDLIREVFLQIIDAVQYCHGNGIYHRDLKPENILVSRSGERVCIADFGLATSEKYSADFGCGSTFYLSPECQGGRSSHAAGYSTAHNDLWSLGVILVNLTCGRNPWKQACETDETFRAFKKNPDFLRTILPVSAMTNEVLKGLFALDPLQRTPLNQLRAQIWATESFTMSDDELAHAHNAARAAALAVRGRIPPKAKTRPAQVVQPVLVPIPAPAPTPAPMPMHLRVPVVPRPPSHAALPPIPPRKAIPQHIELRTPPYTPLRSRYVSSTRTSGSSFDNFPSDEPKVAGLDEDVELVNEDDFDAYHQQHSYAQQPRRCPCPDHHRRDSMGEEYDKEFEKRSSRRRGRDRRDSFGSVISGSSGSGSDESASPATPPHHLSSRAYVDAYHTPWQAHPGAPPQKYGHQPPPYTRTHAHKHPYQHDPRAHLVHVSPGYQHEYSVR